MRTLSSEETAAFGAELDALRAGVLADLGQRDVDHIRRMVRLVRYSETGGRALLHFGIGPITFAVGTSLLGAAKILENMEVGHNIMHGQYDWTGDPALRGADYEWDTACTGDDWRHSHNVEHHTFTNVLGRDRDVGYGLLRISPKQRWHPKHLAQPIAAALLALLFQWGVGLHDLHLTEALSGSDPDARAKLKTRARPFLRKAAWQLGKDYALFPLLAGLNAPRVFAGNLLANLARNVWSFAVIFCGHFPAGTEIYPESVLDGETRGAWYLRQLNGSANIEGSRAFHIASGHLSHQIEHHLFPDLPAARYPELAPRVREICERYGQHYNTGSFAAQLGSVATQIVRNALPSQVRLTPSSEIM
ncbi:MAG TPA: acyl-CoA desaturase [Kofleriaceae bacterium]|jgi:linoleoyl-CoA desaturase